MSEPAPQGGIAATSASPSAEPTARASAMPKLPGRPAARKQHADTGAARKPSSADSQSSPGAATSNNAAGPAERESPPSGTAPTDGGRPTSDPASPATSAAAAAHGPGTSEPAPAGTAPAPPRHSAGPALPPRTPRTGGSASSSPQAASKPAASASKAAGAATSLAVPPAAATAAAASTAPTATPSATGGTGIISSSSSSQGKRSAGAPNAVASAAAEPGTSASATSASTSTASASGAGGAGRKPLAGGLSALPPRSTAMVAPQQGPVLDPDEPEAVAEVRRSIHNVRVQMISAALRLGYDHENALVKQVLYRLALAEKLKAPWRRPGKRPDPVAAAAREATSRTQGGAEAAGGPVTAGSAPSPPGAASSALAVPSSSSGVAPLGFTVKIMMIGLQGSGKTQLAHALLGTGAAVHPFEGTTRRVSVLRGAAHGIGLEFIDTPGLCLGPGGAARNNQVLQQIRRAFHTHRPDLLLYVDRLDAPTPSAGPVAKPGPGGGPVATSTGGLAGAELSVLRSLTTALGQEMWLNTIVAFTHGGSPPPTSYLGASSSARSNGPLAPSFENWLELRSHALQMVIRQASNDERLMNPVAFAESHPACPTNALGQPVLYNGMPWRSHLLLMATSAKLLADTEALLHRQPGGGKGGGAGAAAGGALAAAAAGGGGNALALRQMMEGARQVPMSYIMQQLVQTSRPLKFPDHRNVMDVRRARRDAARLPDARHRREAGAQVALRVLALRTAGAKQRAMLESYMRGNTAGGKVNPEPPRMATRCRPSAQPSEGFRYRTLEPQGGWVVRPHIESHCADSSDGVEGFALNKVGMLGPPGRHGAADGLKGGGVPYHHYISAQYTKDQRLLAARSEATVYHDPLGSVTTSLSADIQTNSSAMPGPGGVQPEADVLMVLRTDTRLRSEKDIRGVRRLPKVTLGTMVARVGGERRLPLGLPLPILPRGPTAVGLRVQMTKKSIVGPGEGAPLRLSAAASVLQRASEVGAGRLGLNLRLPGLRGGNSGRGGAGPGDEACLGFNAEMSLDLSEPLDLPLKRRLPAAVGVSLVRSPEGDTTAALSTSLQYRLGAKEVVAVRATWDKRGRAGVSLRLKTVAGWWAGLVAMLVPLGRMALDTGLDTLRRWDARRRLRRQKQAQRQQQLQALAKQEQAQAKQQLVGGEQKKKQAGQQQQQRQAKNKKA